ncbi:hypothetical protein M2454_000797 [Aequitasia blattaphilus]|uniref:Lipoprotein n=1 Tax=Aequitasia blattaphilus TaxID=2949332 RepID=A0ABT1EAM1_9FIRM|nr:hypothetical protein [Aequitasia blattaphilus]MCP1102002.1 hypothetical protein [Aequitasia blattaphilus]MCR8614642.1 hypothetical protein [Aequitasia blattaphilus]
MKRIIVTMLVLLIFLTSCTLKSNEQVQIEKKEIELSTEKNVIATMGTEAEYDIDAYDLDVVIEHSDQIIYGEVTSMEYIVRENGVGYTKEQVTVKEVLKGDIEVGDVIPVMKMTGYFTVKEYLDSHSDVLYESTKSSFKDMTENEMKTSYIKIENENDILSEVGQLGIYFLGFVEAEKSYFRVCGGYGELLETGKDTFYRMESAKEMIEGDELRSRSTQSIEEESAMVTPYSLEEIENKIQ